MSEIEKYESGELVYWTSIDGHIWHSNKVVQQLKAENEKIDYELCKSIRSIYKLQQCLDEIFENIEYIEATAERIDDDNYIALACKIAETSRIILREIKEVKEE